MSDPLKNPWTVRECFLQSLSPESDRVTADVVANMVRGDDQDVVASVSFRIPFPEDLDNISEIADNAKGEIVNLALAIEAWFELPSSHVGFLEYPKTDTAEPDS